MPVLPHPCAAVVCDTDGVITDTASVHAAVWKHLFDDYLRREADRTGGPFLPFDADDDYRLFVDGKDRYDGAADFLGSRGLTPAHGSPTDTAGQPTVCGLANAKDDLFVAEVTERPVLAFADSVRFFDLVRSVGVPLVAVSASRNARLVLHSAGVIDRFTVVIDGIESERLGLPGKPDPALFIEAADRIGVAPERAVVIEDAIAGVTAARRGGFGLVIGVDRTGHAGALRDAGADLVVTGLGEIGLGDIGLDPTSTARR